MHRIGLILLFRFGFFVIGIGRLGRGFLLRKLGMLFFGGSFDLELYCIFVFEDVAEADCLSAEF